jgi:hypothetical protein
LVEDVSKKLGVFSNKLYPLFFRSQTPIPKTSTPSPSVS